MDKQMAWAINNEIPLNKIEELTKDCTINDDCKKYETETHVYHYINEGEVNAK